MNEKLLRIYLQDHHAGSNAGLELARRVHGGNKGNEYGEALAPIVDEIAADKKTLESIMDDLGFESDTIKDAGAWALEKVGRLKLNGQLTGLLAAQPSGRAGGPDDRDHREEGPLGRAAPDRPGRAAPRRRPPRAPARRGEASGRPSRSCASARPRGVRGLSGAEPRLALLEFRPSWIGGAMDPLGRTVDQILRTVLDRAPQRCSRQTVEAAPGVHGEGRCGKSVSLNAVVRPARRLGLPG